MSGVCRVGGGSSFSVLRVGRGEFRRSLQLRGNVSLGAGVSLRMKLHRWMTMGNLCSLVSEVVAIMTVSMWRTLSDMRRGRSW
jgi:hypothetical protein